MTPTHDPRHPSLGGGGASGGGGGASGGGDPVVIELPAKTAMLLVSLARELGVNTPGEVVMQALGLLQTVRRAAASGQRVLVRDPRTGREIDIAL